MSPLRLVILAILFYIAYRLLVGVRKKEMSDDQQKGKAFKEMPADDLLVEDPVCKKLVPRQQAVQHRDGEQTFYFCIEECCQKFISQEGEGK